MDCIEAIHTRRSVRNFTDEPVTDEQLEMLLRAAMAAPSAGNQQTWRFVVVRDPAIRATLAEATPYAKPMGRAAVGIVVLADPTVEKLLGRWPLDCSAAIENMLLAAHAIGLGGVWLGVHPDPDREQRVGEIIGRPEDFRVVAMVAVGHVEAPGPVVDRYKPEYVRVDSWK